MAKPIVFSGIQPSGNLHIGNYIGALKQWVDNQGDKDNYFCIVDLHAITVPQDPEVLKSKIRELAALYIACGIDPDKSVMFVQSHNPDHAQMGWILNCFTGMGQLERMTQFKDKSEKLFSAILEDRLAKEKGEKVDKSYLDVSVGLFDYPVLMAADILLYNTDDVPVGDDQKQHVELTRDLAQRFNSRYDQEILKLPKPVIGEHSARIMSLQDPTSKMSKSDNNPHGAINLLDDPDTAAEKIKRAVTDSGSEIVFRDDKPAISNLLQIYSELSGKPISDIEQMYAGQGYGKFKVDLAEVVVNTLKPIQEKYHSITQSGEIDQILSSGVETAHKTSSATLQRVMQTVGLG